MVDWKRVVESGALEGKTDAQIADELGITKRTVQDARRRYRFARVPSKEGSHPDAYDWEAFAARGGFEQDWDTICRETGMSARRAREAQRRWLAREGDQSRHRVELAQLSARLRGETRARKAAERHAVLADERAEACVLLGERGTHVAEVKPFARKRKGHNRAVPVLMCSDWHVEEVVDPRTVNGRNAYGPDIARKRVEYLAEGAAWFARQWASHWDIDHMVVWLGGDLISGYIHEELEENNALSPIEATLLAQELAAFVIDSLLASCKFLRRITVPCSYGNHGRTGARKRIATGAKNSYEWLAYKSLATRYAGNERVQFEVADGAHLYTAVCGQRVRWTHGDDVRYYGGVGGLSIPLRKATDAWDEFETADVTCVGHFHTFTDFGFAVVNGSLIGYNAYALSIKARWEPARQAMFLIDEEWGRRLVTPVYVDAERKAK